MISIYKQGRLLLVCKWQDLHLLLPNWYSGGYAWRLLPGATLGLPMQHSRLA